MDLKTAKQLFPRDGRIKTIVIHICKHINKIVLRTNAYARMLSRVVTRVASLKASTTLLGHEH